MAAATTVAQVTMMQSLASGRPSPVAGVRRRARSDRILGMDARLIERCLKGDEAAWEQLVSSHAGRVYAICFRFTNSRAEAQDITQEVFLRVFRSLKSYRPEQGSFLAWLTRLTRNLLIDHYRRGKMDRATDSLDEQLPMLREQASPSSRTEALVAGREAGEILQAALQKLSPDLRETVILRDLEQLEYREIAAVLKVPEGTVKSRLNRGRAELGRILRRRKVRI